MDEGSVDDLYGDIGFGSSDGGGKGRESDTARPSHTAPGSSGELNSLYGDLNNSAIESSLLAREQSKSSQLEKEIARLTEENRALKLKVQHLERNISCLYMTAKEELRRNQR